LAAFSEIKGGVDRLWAVLILGEEIEDGNVFWGRSDYGCLLIADGIKGVKGVVVRG
jgi:hypothetical protein